MEPTSYLNFFGDILETVLTFVSGIVGGSFGLKLLDYWLEKRKARKYNDKSLNITEGLEAVSNMYQYMDLVIDKTSAERVILFKGSNGGGLPLPTSEFYIKGIHECSDGSINSDDLLEKYKSVLIDGHYANILKDIVTHGSIKIDVNSMQDCLLKRLYTSENTKYAELHYLGAKGLVNKKEKFEMFYLSISTTANNDFSLNEDRLQIQLNVDNIKKIFQKYKS